MRRLHHNLNANPGAVPYGDRVQSEERWRAGPLGQMVLGWADVQRFTRVELTAWLQCAGNRRGHFQPKAAGGQWDRGAVGNARWSGVRLRDVLLSANPTVKAHHVALEGGDPNGAAPPYVRSIPIEKALDPNTLLVFEMNSQPLPVLHGFPVRALVPGWVGSANTSASLRATDDRSLSFRAAGHRAG